MARCSYCKALEPSSTDLAFFEDRSATSQSAKLHCKCGYYESAHDKEALAKITREPVTVIERGICEGFQPHGEYEFDGFYCGCRGWD